MILFTILALMIAVMVIGAILTLGVGGGVLGVLFSDIIVCIALVVVLLVKFILKRKNK